MAYETNNDFDVVKSYLKYLNPYKSLSQLVNSRLGSLGLDYFLFYVLQGQD
jgi:hypothetical protein